MRAVSETVFERSLQLFKSDIKRTEEKEKGDSEILKHKQMVG